MIHIKAFLQAFPDLMHLSPVIQGIGILPYIHLVLKADPKLPHLAPVIGDICVNAYVHQPFKPYPYLFEGDAPVFVEYIVFNGNLMLQGKPDLLKLFLVQPPLNVGDDIYAGEDSQPYLSKNRSLVGRICGKIHLLLHPKP